MKTENQNHRPDHDHRHHELARAYIPFQHYTTSYPLPEALRKGTLFPELWIPYQPGKWGR